MKKREVLTGVIQATSHDNAKGGHRRMRRNQESMNHLCCDEVYPMKKIINLTFLRTGYGERSWAALSEGAN